MIWILFFKKENGHVNLKILGRRAIIGKGFVGSTLNQPGRFTNWYDSKSTHTMSGHYELIVIAAPSATKYLANELPQIDWESICNLTAALSEVTADRVILISTIDAEPKRVEKYNEFYGKHRLSLERFVQRQFENHLIVRLPALFGRGLKKNILYDLLNKQADYLANPDDTYQWFNIERLWSLIKQFYGRSIGVRGFYSEPISVREIVERFFSDNNYPFWIDRAPYEYKERGRLTADKEALLEEMEMFINEWRAEHVN
jgi:hypothetical protein